MATLLSALSSLIFFSCSEEQELLVPEQTNSLRIASVTIDGQQVARSRAVADDGTAYTPDNLPYNQSINAFTAGDQLALAYGFGDETEHVACATLGTDGAWTLTKAEYDNTTDILTDLGTPITIAPDKAKDEKWTDLVMQATFGNPMKLYEEDEAFATVADDLGIVKGEGIDVVTLKSDFLAAISNAETQDYDLGSITIDTDVKSPTLGAVTIRLKHYDVALLRLPLSKVNVTPGTYIKDGKAYNVTGLATLWAEVREDDFSGNLVGSYPLTRVTIDGVDYLQAIVTAYQNGSQTLTGFKAVMKVDESGEMRDENGEMGDESGNENSPLSTLHSTLTLDLPFTVGTGNSSPESGEVPQAEGSVALAPNTRYPLTLTIAPTRSTVTLTDPLGKPGWGTDEEELSNLPNELDDMIVTIDDTPYLRLDPTQTTDVATVKTLLHLAIEQKGITHLCVTGETLAAYDGGYALTVVGEAIRTGEFADVTLTLLLPDATAIGAYAFEGCHALASVSAPKATEIGAYAFVHCRYLASISAPEALTIGDYAFDNCTALASVELPKVTTIGSNAFSNCSIASVELPEATTIGKYAFRDCGPFESVSLPKVTEIGAYAFMGCTALMNVEFPSITTIGSNAFSGSHIPNLSLPSVIEIGAYAFENCILSNVEFPSITTIGSNAFSGGNIVSLSFGSVIESVGTDAFSDVPTETCDLTLVSGSTGNPDVENKKWLDLTWHSITLISTNE